MSEDRPGTMHSGPCPSCGQPLHGHEFSLAPDGSWQAQCTSCGALVAWTQIHRTIDLRDGIVV